MKYGFMIDHEKFVPGGMAFEHYHWDEEKQEYFTVSNNFKKIGKRFLGNCSFCGSRVEIRK